jgi:trigger factor
VETLDDLKAFIRKDFTERKQKEAEAAADNKLFDKLYEKIEVDLPDVLVDEEVQAQINQLANQLQSYNMSLTSYLQMMNRTADQLKEDYRDNAVKSVALRLGLEKISELENLAPTEEDINKEFENLASQYNMEVDQLKTMIDPEMMKNDVKNQKAYEFIKNNAVKA